MSILSRVKISPQQRYDLEDFLAEQSAARTDSKLWTQKFLSENNLIMGGFSVSGIGLTQATVGMSGAAFIFPQSTADFSYFVSSSTEPDVVIPDSSLVDGARNYVEALLTTQDGTPLTKAFWDPEANSGAGQEFNQIVNTITDLKCSFVVSTGGFTGSPDRLPVAIIDCDNSGVIKIILDRRQLYGRLALPNDIDNGYSWGTKVEPVYNLSMTGVTGTFVSGETITIGSETAIVITGGTSSITFNVPSGISFSNGDSVTGGTSGATGTINTILESFSGVDKSLKGQKMINDALMTEMKGIKGVRFWWMDAPSLGGIKAELASVIAPTTSSAQIIWDGSNLRITDGNLTPTDTDVVAAIRILASTKNLLLTRQDDGKEVATISLSDVPDSGSLGLTIGVHTLSIAWNDSTATIQSDWNGSGAYAATISGSAATKKIVITANAAGVQASHVTLGANTLKKGAVTVTPSLVVKQGMAADGSISIPDGDFLFVTLPNPLADATYDGVGTSALNYQVASRGALAITDQSYWIAYREGTKLIWRGGLELQTGESSSIGDTVPQSLLDAIGLASETSTPAYSSDIRGVSSESIVSRVGALTDAIGDEQEDRSAYFRSDSQVTWTGTQLQFTSDIILEILNTKTGVISQHTILAANSPMSLADGDSVYVQIDRTQSSETVTPVNSSVTPIPAQTQSKKDIIVFAHRKDVSGAGYLHIPFHKQVLESGQTVRLGASGSGSGSGSGTGDDLDSLKFLASFGIDQFTDLPTSTKSAVDSGNTTATYDTANKVYRGSYDASKTVTGTGTSMHLSASPAYSVAVGDVLIVNQVAKRITALGTINSDGGVTTPFTIESAFSSNPVAAAACVSNVFTTVDLRAHTEASTGLSIAAVISDPVSQYMLRYEDSVASGDTVWDYPGAPAMAFSVSADGTNWTGVNTRPTAITTQEPLRSVAVSGSEFIARFFSSATSGSGSFNLIKYKVFMHYSSDSISPNYSNSAVCRTDGSGTAANCSVASDSGKTRVTTTFNFGSQILVWLDGKKLPLFIDSVTTPGAYYKIISSNIIELDADYSGLGIQFELLVSANTIDNTDSNAANISAIQDTSTAISQGFVDESAQLSPVNGTPGTGQFRSSITNRASIPDLANNLKARMGIERIPTQFIYPLPSEYGPNGEPAFSVLNDDRGLIRFCGSWTNFNDSAGARPISASNTTDFVEITFFGTGLSAAIYMTGSRDIRVSVDGGVEGSNIAVAENSMLVNRNYAAFTLVNIVAGLSLGLHTVKIRNNSGSAPLDVSGFEIITEQTTVNMRPGTAYSQGRKLVVSSPSNVSYLSGFDTVTQNGGSVAFSQTKGARVVEYVKLDSTRGKAANLAPSSQGNLSGADHTYEDPVRTYFPREFGASRSTGDDFSFNTGGSPSAYNFVLDDGQFAMDASACTFVPSSQRDQLTPISVGGFWKITFVGTGLDILRADDGNTTIDSHQVLVDGNSIGNLTGTASTASRVQKIVSGLPFGTHTVTVIRTATSNFGVGVLKFIVYQPKKPSLPAGAVEIADYCIPATYVANSTAGVHTIGTGVIRKHMSRETKYVGSTWSSNTMDPTVYAGAWIWGTTASGDYFEQTFFGTGFDFRTQTNTSQASNVTVTLNGTAMTSTNFQSMVTSTYGGNVFTASTGTLNTNNTLTRASGFSVSGLPLGFYKVRFTNNSGGSAFYAETLDVIMPVFAYKNQVACIQNTISVGSQSLGDTRKVSGIKEIVTRGWGQAQGVNADPQTNRTAAEPVPNLTTVVQTKGGRLKIQFAMQQYKSTSANSTWTQVYVDGIAVGPVTLQTSPSANYQITSLGEVTVPVAPGFHKVDVYWFVDGASTATAYSVNRILTAEEQPS